MHADSLSLCVYVRVCLTDDAALLCLSLSALNSLRVGQCVAIATIGQGIILVGIQRR